MHFTDEEFTAVVGHVSLRRDPFLQLKNAEYQERIFSDTEEWLRPLLQALPPATTPEQLLSHRLLIEELSLTLLVKAVRRTQIYRDAPEEDILLLLEQQHILQAAEKLYTLGLVALDSLPPLKPMEELIEEISTEAFDDELARLLDTDGDLL